MICLFFRSCMWHKCSVVCTLRNASILWSMSNTIKRDPSTAWQHVRRCQVGEIRKVWQLNDVVVVVAYISPSANHADALQLICNAFTAGCNSWPLLLVGYLNKSKLKNRWFVSGAVVQFDTILTNTGDMIMMQWHTCMDLVFETRNIVSQIKVVSILHGPQDSPCLVKGRWSV